MWKEQSEKERDVVKFCQNILYHTNTLHANDNYEGAYHVICNSITSGCIMVASSYRSLIAGVDDSTLQCLAHELSLCITQPPLTGCVGLVCKHPVKQPCGKLLSHLHDILS